MKKLIIGISAADGVRIGWRLLELLREMSEVETYLVVSRMAEQNFRLECGIEAERVKALANHCYEPENLAAKIASGSFYTDGMIIARTWLFGQLAGPCGRCLPEGEPPRGADAAGDATEPDSPAQYNCGCRGWLCHHAADADVLQPPGRNGRPGGSCSGEGPNAVWLDT